MPEVEKREQHARLIAHRFSCLQACRIVSVVADRFATLAGLWADDPGNWQHLRTRRGQAIQQRGALPPPTVLDGRSLVAEIVVARAIGAF